MITVYSDNVYRRLYKIFKEHNLFKLAEAYYDYNSRDMRLEKELALLTAWIDIRKEYDNGRLILPEDCHIYYNLSKEYLSLYCWMDTCISGRPSSYCHTCSNFQVHFMKHNKTFIVSTPDGVSAIDKSNILDKHIYDEYLDYKMLIENQKRAVDLRWWESSVHNAITGLSRSDYNIYEIISCIRHVSHVWDCYLKDQEESQEEDDE